MERDIQTYKVCSENVTLCLIFSGVWSATHPVLKKIAFFVTFFSTFSIMAHTLNFSLHNAQNVRILVRGLAAASSFLSISSKAFLFLQHQNDLNYLKDYLTEKFMSDMKNPENLPDLLSNMRMFAVFVTMYKTTIAFIMSMYCIVPLFSFLKYGKYLRVYPCLYPFSFVPGGVVHWLLYGWESTGALSAWAISVGTDCAFGMYAIQICGEQRVLARKLKDLRVGSNYTRELRDCMERHHLIITAKNTFESLYGLISIWLAISGAIVLCSLIFQVTEYLENRGGYVRAIIFFAHFSGKMMQVFMYAWYGNLINEESLAFPRAIYSSHWTDCCDTRFKNDILIVLAQRPLIVTALGCMNVQLDMFAKIVKTSISYFFLLQTLKAKTEEK
ncbi:odorant receptor 251 isoform X1 [Nasonia vitripennis]|uniref:Odorant receptor n=1 Tax=Nasonia vitripennis TaxID=7425 RepID=A0A7M6USJ0_NASVI|nr:odorant receptor 251 [Nasonia vitripennis]XP_016845920.1 odorant receptor 251 isoform X1 [Nasonia vitripennis]